MQAVAKRLPRQLEDALAYLPRKGVIEYRRGQLIYDEQHPSPGLSLVMQGRVKVAMAIDDGSQTVTGIYGADEFFGESSLLGASHHEEYAKALDTTTAMTWTAGEIEEQIERQPRLGMALMQMMVERCLNLEERLHSLALDKTPQRVALALCRLAERAGARGDDGASHMPPLTHQLLSEYVGTSREIVTFQMNLLRQQGYLRYSRKGIEVFTEALQEHLHKQPR